MSTIAGVGGYGSLSLMEFKTGKRGEEQQKDSLFSAPAVVPSQRTVDASAARDYQAQQATEEGFARLRVSMQTTSAGTAQTSVESGRVDTSQKVDKSDRALQEFKAYMAKTPAERMRDSILKEMGLTKEDIEAMPPEKQKAIEEEIAERMRDKAQMQAQADRSPEEQVYGVL